MKVVVTGGAGFIGSHVAEAFGPEDEIVVLDDLSTGCRENLAGISARLIEGSIRDAGRLAEAMAGVDAVVHLAAEVSVPASMKDPIRTAEINVLGLLETLEAARRAGARKFVFASSAAVYGENPAPLKSESLPPDPRSPYAITKLDGEYYCALYDREGWLETVSIRFFNVFGPRQSPHGPYAAAVSTFFERAVRNEPIEIHGDGLQTRDFVYVKDIASALAFACRESHVRGVFNAGYGKGTAVVDLAHQILTLTHSRSTILHVSPRPGDLRESACDPSRLLAAGWKARWDLSSGLEATATSLRR